MTPFTPRRSQTLLGVRGELRGQGLRRGGPDTTPDLITQLTADQ